MADKEIKVTPFGDGSGAKIDIYSPSAKEEPHDSIHIKIDTETGKGRIIEKDGDGPRQEADTQCYLTTACMKHFLGEFNDDCYELTTLRWFRDNYVSEEDIMHYYEIAPLIVNAINNLPECEQIYNYIYEDVIDICVKAIERGDYVHAYDRYRSSILALESELTDSIEISHRERVLIHRKS